MLCPFREQSMTFFVLIVSLSTLVWPSTVIALDASPQPADRSSAIIQVNRLLEEELKLAARPQIYLVLDLDASVLIIKSRGIELHRVPIQAWRRDGDRSIEGTYRLRARPAVSRPKAAPADDTSVTAIELQHMPDQYELVFDPGVVIAVSPLQERPWIRLKRAAQDWWNGMRHRLRIGDTDVGTSAVRISIMLEQEAARSLAWTATDGMPILIGLTTLP
jgi:hypothetical protein